MKKTLVAAASLGLVMCLWVAGGCAAGRDTARTGTSRQAFPRELDDPNNYRLLLTGQPQTCGMRSGRVRLAPGQSIGSHSTKSNEELLVFLSGHGIARIGADLRLQVGAGRVAYIPPQSEHDIVNTGTEPLVYVFCVAPVTNNR